MTWVLEQTQPHTQLGAEMPQAERQHPCALPQTTTELTGALPTDQEQQTLAQDQPNALGNFNKSLLWLH